MNVFISQILYAQFCNVIQKVANTKMCPQGLLYRISKKWKKYIKKKKRISETLSIAINHNLWRQYKDWTFVALHRRGIYVLLYLNVSSYSVTLLRFLFCFFFFLSLVCVESIVFKQCRFKVWVSSILPCRFSSEKQEYGSWPGKHPAHSVKQNEFWGKCWQNSENVKVIRGTGVCFRLQLVTEGSLHPEGQDKAPLPNPLSSSFYCLL